MPNRILNTNMGLGFQRGRKYDMDFDRFGRMLTSHAELRKTRDLNFQKELRKAMNTYSIKRFSDNPEIYRVIMTESELKCFSEYLQREFGMGDIAGGVVNGVRDVAGNVVSGAGKMIGSGVGQLVGGGIGTAKGAAIGAAALGSVVPVLGHIGGGILGGIAGGFLGKKAAEVGGSTLKNIGQDIHS